VTAPDNGQTTYQFLSNATYDLFHIQVTVTIGSKITYPNGDYDEELWAQNRPYNYYGTNNTLNQNNTLADPGLNNPYVKTRFHTSGVGQAQQTAITDYTYDRNGNVLTATQYDWAAPSVVNRSNGVPTGFNTNGLTVLRTVTNTHTYRSGLTPPPQTGREPRPRTRVTGTGTRWGTTLC